MQTPLTRLMAKVRIERDGCWTWVGAKGPKGTGAIRVNGKVTRPQRLSYYLHNGPIPNGRQVMHTCDNPLCVNPEHLYVTGRKRKSDKVYDTLIRFDSNELKQAWAANTYDKRALGRLMEKIEVDESTGCWNWTGAAKQKGYPNTVYKGRHIGAHRLMFILKNGLIPKGMNVCHCCDNKLCINPDHLFVGTQKDNMDDMAQKGRHSHGKGHAAAIIAWWTPERRRRQSQITKGRERDRHGHLLPK